MKKRDFVRKRILLKAFKDMLVSYVAEDSNDTMDLRKYLKVFWDYHIDSIEFYASLLVRRPYEEDLKSIVDEVEAMEVMFYFMFHFADREDEWFYLTLYEDNELQKRKNGSYIQMSDFLLNMREERGGQWAQKVGCILCKEFAGTTTVKERYWLKQQIKMQIDNVDENPVTR